MHSNVTGNETRVVDVPWNANGPGYHDYWAVVYNDYTTIFYDGVAVQSFRDSSRLERSTGLYDYQLWDRRSE